MAGIIILLAALVFPWWYGTLEGTGDARKIFRDGSKDSLKERWHIGNGLRRGAILTFAALAHWLLLLYTLNFGLLVLPAYLAYAVALFGYRFTTRLNTCRKLPKWYVSRDGRASAFDKRLVAGYDDKFFVWAAKKWDRFLAYLRLKFGLNFTAALLTPESFSRLLHTVFLLAAIAFLAVVIVQNFR